MSAEPLTPLQRAVLSLQAMRARVEALEALEAAKTEPIAIVGMGCRFPGGAEDPERYWDLLREGQHAVTEVPAGRWDCDALFSEDASAPGKTYARHGGFLPAVDGFDAAFFGISPREARSLDPQQRLLLEVAWEALERAGYANEATRGTRTGVFVGMTAEDYAQFSVHSGDLSRIDPHAVLGNGRSVAAGRIAFSFALQGPVLQLDTTCSSSLVAVHLAAQSLRAGECDMALAAGVNLMLWPGGTIGFSHMNALARDGRCKALDAGADGYVRGEGCGVVVLRRLRDSLRDRDHIVAVLRGSAINHDGRTSGLTVPNGLAQETVIREALANARLRPEQVGYVELHGTGTPLGDPIEVQALCRAMAAERTVDRPLWIGSVKTNIGHLEAAAGMAGMIKAILAMQHGGIPAHLNFTTPNPAIPWQALPVQVPRRLEPWPAGMNPRRAGISAFGMSGTNVHVIVEEAPKPLPLPPAVARCQLFCLSARSQPALRELAARYASHLEKERAVSLEDVCYTANAGRNHFRHRLAIVADSVGMLQQQLFKFARGQPSEDVRYSECEIRLFPSIAFVAPAGETTGSDEEEAQEDDLADSYPVFRAARERYETLDPRPELPVFGYALWQLWTSFGVAGPVVRDQSSTEKPDVTLFLQAAETNRKALLAELSRMYRLGLQIDWQAVHEGESHRKLILPVYPFERQSFWFASAKSEPPRLQEHFYELVWREQTIRRNSNVHADDLRASLERSLEDRRQQPTVGSSQRMQPQLDAASVACVVQAFRQLGVVFTPGERLGGMEWRRHVGLLPRYERLMDRLLNILAGAGIVAGREWTVLRIPPSGPIEFPASPEGELLRVCGPRLADVVRGACDPLTLIFPEGDASRAAAIYADSAAGSVMNGLAASACSLLSRGAEGIRVLEIGAGTGSTTTKILPALAARCAEYVFTDISPSFFAGARQRHAAYPFFSCRTLDIERDPVVQGFSARSFDLIVAANVFHASTDLAASLERARALLAPGGHLVVIEGTVPVAWLDLTFGMTDGWWRFSDIALRPSHPLVSMESWRRVLTDTGFDDVAVIGGDQEDGLAGQALVVARSARQPRHWLVFEGSGPEGRQLAERIAESGDRCTMLAPDGDWPDGDWKDLHETGFAGAVFFPVLHGTPGSGVPGSATRICQNALRVTQELMRRFHPPPPLWIVTRGATPINQSRDEAGLAQSVLPGFSHACSAEKRDFSVAHIDLETDESPDDGAALFEEIRSGTTEQRVAFHGGQRHVARLVSANAGRARPFSIRPDAMYLIAGGLGGLGLVSAEWLVRQGARHVALLGRTPPSQEALARIHTVENAGAEVLVRQVDLADDAGVSRAIASIARTGLPLRGVIHSAGILDDASLERQTPEKFERVMAAKVGGAWSLHTNTLNQPLDFFVLFSSVVSVLGSFGQSNHAAASSFLDGLAAFRHRRHLPALSINWSTWSGVGAAARLQADEHLKGRGVVPIAPAEGIEALDLLVRRQGFQTAVAPIDWAQFAKGMRPAPFLEEVLPRGVVPAVERAPDFRGTEPPARRERRLHAYLQQALADTLGFAGAADIDLDKGFFEQGLDSLTSIEFRDRLQSALNIPLAATVTFDFPSIRRLAGHLLQLLQPTEPPQARRTNEVAAPSLSDMSESEVEALLLSKLDSIRY